LHESLCGGENRCRILAKVHITECVFKFKGKNIIRERNEVQLVFVDVGFAEYTCFFEDLVRYQSSPRDPENGEFVVDLTALT